MFYLVSTSGKVAYGVKSFVLDTESDLPSIDVNSCTPGSVAFIIKGPKKYILNSSKEWKNIPVNGGGGGDSPEEEEDEDVIYNGGDV